uniref:Uncharacterized protein n=1 Tax=Ditylenchus dipsaci TaxID=166011 RepID=A0A915E0S3_9BILA
MFKVVTDGGSNMSKAFKDIFKVDVNYDSWMMKMIEIFMMNQTMKNCRRQSWSSSRSHLLFFQIKKKFRSKLNNPNQTNIFMRTDCLMRLWTADGRICNGANKSKKAEGTGWRARLVVTSSARVLGMNPLASRKSTL